MGIAVWQGGLLLALGLVLGAIVASSLCTRRQRHTQALLRSRTAFLAMTSHELRTPMITVLGLSDLLLDAPLEPEHRRHVQTINDSTRALLGLVDDLLDLAKLDADAPTLSPVPFDLRRLSASVGELLRLAAEARAIELTIDVGPSVPQWLIADETRLRQVLVNLVANAIEFTERGGVRLRITARALGEGDHELAFRVEDTGIGMPSDVVARLFRPFAATHAGVVRRHGGTGLGLAISRRIVMAMGSDIAVESQPGRGSVFSFTLRLAATTAPPAPRRPTLRSRRVDRLELVVLVVDDHPTNQEVARAKLRHLGCRVELASDGPQALAAVSSTDYDVVFMDLRLAGMSGIEVVMRIRERLAGRPTPRFIAMTASRFAEDREACRAVGMRDFVGKPLDLAHVAAVLSRTSEGATPVGGRLRESPARHSLARYGEPRFFDELLRLFVVETHKRLACMTDALRRGDAAEVEGQAHVLKSASATVGAIGMSELFASIEGVAHAGVLTPVAAWIDMLSAELAETERISRGARG